jgi:hypothetical protein
MDPITPAIAAALAAVAKLTGVSMVLCMLCGGTSPDGYFETLQFPTMQACEKAAGKIEDKWAAAVPICLLEPQFIRDEVSRAVQEADNHLRWEGAVEVCGSLGSFERYQFANMEACVYTFAGPIYREAFPPPEGYVDYDGLPPVRE